MGRLRHRHGPQPGPHHADEPQLGVERAHPEPDVRPRRVQDIQHVSAPLRCARGRKAELTIVQSEAQDQGLGAGRYPEVERWAGGYGLYI